MYQLRAQFPFGEVAEFCLTYHGLKKELRAPVLSELWKLNVRYLPLAKLFELVAQVEVTSVGMLFPRLTERLRQEGGHQRVSWGNRGMQWNPGGQRNNNWGIHNTFGWQPSYRHNHNPQTNHDYTRQATEHKPANKQLVKKTEDQSA